MKQTNWERKHINFKYVRDEIIMSACQIRFKETYVNDDYKKHDKIQQIYVTSGFPLYVVKNLYNFFNWYMTEPITGNDVAYLVSNFVNWCRGKNYGDRRRGKDLKIFDCSIEKVGKIRGNESWIYEVDITNAETPDDVWIRYSNNFSQVDAFRKAKWSKWYRLGELYGKISST